MIVGRYSYLVIAVVLDLILGDPPQWPHPVRLMGWFVTVLERGLRSLLVPSVGLVKGLSKKARERLAGTLLVGLVLFLSLGSAWLLLTGAELIHPFLRQFIEIWLCYQMLAAKALKVESMKVYDTLQKEGLVAARQALSMIVGRDTNALSEEGVVKATVETIAENTSDGVIAPLLFMAIGGVWGGIFYKAVNTMDSMLGYQNERYQYFGTTAARLDDLCNWFPARVAAGLMMIASFLLGFDTRQAYQIWKRDRFAHQSPNSAQTEAACAGALGIQLAGNAYYFGELHEKPTIGDPLNPVKPTDIIRANHLLYGTFFLGVLLLVGSSIMFIR